MTILAGPADWIRIFVLLLETAPAAREAMRWILGGRPEAQRVRDILADESESERAARELRELAEREGR